MSFLRWPLIALVTGTLLVIGVRLPQAAERVLKPSTQPQHRDSSDRPFREFVCLQAKFNQGQPLSDLSSFQELGIRWVRDVVHWPLIETAPGVYRDFPDAFKRRLAYYRKHDIGVVFLLAYGNSVAYPPTAEAPHKSVDPEAFGRYAVAVARMLREAGVRFVLEIWNEPHNFVLRKLIGGAWNAKPPSPWVDHYVKMVREAVRQVKAFDPAIRLLTDDDMWIIHYWFLEAGLPREIDGFAFHPYTRRSPEKAAVGVDTDWVKPFQVVDADGSFTSAVRRLREQGKAKLGKVPEMWITEWGWPIGHDTAKGQVSEDVLVGYLPRAFIIAKAAGVEVMCWFSARDAVDGPMGLTANDGRRRKTYYAFKTMTEQLGDFVLVRQVAGAHNPTSGVQAFLFRGPRNHKLVVWDVAGGQRFLPLQGALRNASAVNAVGLPVPPAPDHSGDANLGFDGVPIYISGVRDDASLTAMLDALK